MTHAPAPGRGAAIGGGIAIAAIALGAALVVRALGGDVTTGVFLSYVVGASLIAIGVLFGYWGWGCSTLAYGVDGATLRVRWGLREVIVPLASIDIVAAAPRPDRIAGLNWPGHHVGRTMIEGSTPAHVFATSFADGQAVYVRAGALILVVTPADPDAFIAEVETRRRGAPSYVAPPRSAPIEVASVLSDRASLTLAIVGALVLAASFALLFVRYDDLASTLTVDYPISRDSAHLIDRDELFAIPLTGLALHIANLAAGVVLHRSQRALAQTLIGGSIFLQAVLLIALAAAV